jgi:DNA end-binding protein Ku
MPRPVWSGTISFGLVAIPIKLFHGVSKKSVSFNQLDDRTMSRIRLKKVSAETGEDVPDDHIVKGYELSKGRYVVVDPDELEPFIPSATKSIDLEEFVDLDEIDPVYFDTPYIVAPDKTPKPYVLLARAMEEAGKVAIGRFVMRNKQYVAALRAQDGKLLMSTMVFADEVVKIESIDELEGLDEIDISSKEVKMAEALVESLSASFEPDKYRDEYREQVLDLIERKAGGEEFEAPAAVAAPPKVVDLMAALEASVKAAKDARKRHPAGGPHEEAAAKTSASSTAKKTSSKAAAAEASDASDDDTAAIAKPKRVRKSA